MFYSRLYFENYVYPNDPKKACRQNILILATDGAETCDDDGRHVDRSGHLRADARQQLLARSTRSCRPAWPALGGHPQGRAGLHPDRQRLDHGGEGHRQRDGGGGRHRAGDLRDADRHQRGQARRWSTSSPRRSRPARSATASTTTATARSTRACRTVPDVHGRQHDRRLRQLHDRPRQQDRSGQRAGARTAAPPGTARSRACNCQDDNCNGQVDEGLPPNACGQPCGCALPTELCDGLDNDCDGDIDEGFMVGASCINNGVGACRRGGILACRRRQARARSATRPW